MQAVGVVEVVFTARVQGAHSDRALCTSTETTSTIPHFLFFFLAFKLYPPPPLPYLFHPAGVFIDPATRLGLALTYNPIRPSAVLLHHLKGVFSKRG